MKYRKIALIFPGQGSQYVGMGKQFYDAYPVAREAFDQAGEALGFDLAEMCFKKPGLGKMLLHGEDLNRTVNTQPAVLTTGYACYRVFMEACKEAGVELPIAFLAGHSLGEYTALVAGGALAFQDAVPLVHKRATFMTELGEGYPGAGLMAVVDRKKDLDYEKLQALCNTYQVYITLKNTRKQVVVGGSKKQMAEMEKELKDMGLFSTLLKVEGPFHTPIMKPAAERFKQELASVKLLIATRPVLANVSAEAIADPVAIRRELYEQIFTIVDWKTSVEKMVANEADCFIEIGPKRVLSNMIRDIDASVPQLNVEDPESLEKTLREL